MAQVMDLEEQVKQLTEALNVYNPASRKKGARHSALHGIGLQPILQRCHTVGLPQTARFVWLWQCL